MAGLKFTEIQMPLCPSCWAQKCELPCPAPGGSFDAEITEGGCFGGGVGEKDEALKLLGN